MQQVEVKPEQAIEKPSELIPGNIPFPPIDESDASATHDVAATAQVSQPPPLYPPLPRGMTPFKPPSDDERRALRLGRAMRAFFRSSVHHHGERDGDMDRRAREGDVARWGDRDGDRDGDKESDADEDEDDVDDVKWVKIIANAMMNDAQMRVSDEAIVPREIMEAAFGADASALSGKRKDVESGPGSPTRRGAKRARVSDGGRHAGGAQATTSKRGVDGLSRLERLARLESMANDEDERATRAGRAEQRHSGRGGRDRSTSKNPRPRRSGNEDEEDDDEENRFEEDDDLDSDDDYARNGTFDDDDGYDEHDAGGDGGEAFY